MANNINDIKSQTLSADEDYRHELMEAKLKWAEYRYQAIQEGIFPIEDDEAPVSEESPIAPDDIS